MSTSSYDALPAPAQGSGSPNNQRLVIALAVVTFIAIVGPLLVFMFARNSSNDTASDQSLIAGGDLPTAVASPAPVEATAPPIVAAAPTDVAQPTAAATAVPATSVPATPATGPVAAAPTPAPPAAPVPVAAPVVKQLTGEAPAVFKVTGISAGSSLNVRQSAGTTNPLIGTIANTATGIAGTGRRVSVDGSEWREIKFNNGTGWVFAGYLAPAPAPVAAATATPVPTSAPEVVKVLAAESPAVFSVTGISPGASLNVRAEPGRDQRLLGVLPGNTAAVPSTGRRTLVGQTEWREIGYRDGTGWVDASYLKVVPEPPKTVLLPTVASSTIGIVPLNTANDRLALRADPGYGTDVVGTVGASAVNITATGHAAQIDTEVWIEITASGTTGWVPRQLTIPVVKSAADVIASSGVAAVKIDQVTVAENGTITVRIGTQSVAVAPNTTVISRTGAQASAADWAHIAKTATSTIAAEVSVAGGQITRVWLAA